MSDGFAPSAGNTRTMPLRPSRLLGLLCALAACGTPPDSGERSVAAARQALGPLQDLAEFTFSTRELAAGGRPGYPKQLVPGGAGLMAFWLDGREPYLHTTPQSGGPVPRLGVYAARVQPDGATPLEQNLRVLSAAEASVDRFAAAYGDGLYAVVVFRQDKDVLELVRVRDDGTLLDGGAPVAITPTPPAGWDLDELVSLDFAAGSFCVTWVLTKSNSSDEKLLTRRFSASGLPLGDAIELGASTRARLTFDGSTYGAFLTRYTTNQTLTFQRFTIAGTPIGTPTVLWTAGTNQWLSLLDATLVNGTAIALVETRTSSSTGTVKWPTELRAFKVALSTGAAVSQTVGATGEGKSLYLAGMAADGATGALDVLWQRDGALALSRVGTAVTDLGAPVPYAALPRERWAQKTASDRWIILGNGAGGAAPLSRLQGGVLTPVGSVRLDVGVGNQQGFSLASSGQKARLVWTELDLAGRSLLRSRELGWGELGQAQAGTPLTAAGAQQTPFLAYSGGEATLLWTDGEATFLQHWAGPGWSPAAGKPLAPAYSDPLGAFSHPALGTVVCWVKGGGPRCAVLDASGAPTPADGTLVNVTNTYGGPLAITASTQQFLIVWETNGNVVGRLFDGSLTPRSTELALGASTSYEQPLAIASDGSGFLVAWSHSVERRIYAQRVAADGALLGPALPLSPAGVTARQPTLAFARGVYLAAWIEGDASGVGVLRGARVTPQGALGDSPPLLLGPATPTAREPQLAPLGDGFLLAYAALDTAAPTGVLRLTGRYLAVPPPLADGGVAQEDAGTRPEDGGAPADAGTSADGGTPAGPAFLSAPPTVAVCGLPYRYQPVVSGQGPLTFQLSGAPAGMTVTPATGEVGWLAQASDVGEHHATLWVTGAQGTAQQALAVTVKCPDLTLDPTGCHCSSGLQLGGALALALLLRARRRGSRAQP